jgi:hypothetical protein
MLYVGALQNEGVEFVRLPVFSHRSLRFENLDVEGVTAWNLEATKVIPKI